jgi:hypothetical protein
MKDDEVGDTRGVAVAIAITMRECPHEASRALFSSLPENFERLSAARKARAPQFANLDEWVNSDLGFNAAQ